MADAELKYEETQPYLTGTIYKEFGELLMNPNTTLRQLVLTGHKFGLRLTISTQPIQDSEEINTCSQIE